MKLTTNNLSAIVLGLALLLVCRQSQSADINKGQQLYAVNCAICHGQTGRSVMPGAPNFDSGDSLLRPDTTLLASLRSGKNAMPAFQGILTDQEIMDVIAYLRTMH